MKNILAQKDNFFISTDESALDIQYIHGFISQSYWAAGIPLETLQRSIKGSLCFGLYDDEKQIGFARVVSDKATFGYLADVFVDEKYRGKGLGAWMMSVIMSHPDLQGFRNWMLGTRDAHELYKKFGFTQLDQPERIMRKNDPDVYKR
ncbi:MAG: GNAT family N-acetyltransferase [Bacteroidetes bacterium]|nr:GNAT family N-acetyltransferase [Bacteroidota bacterium]